MRLTLFLSGILTLVSSVSGAPTKLRPQQHEDSPGIQKVRLSDVETWVEKGIYGDSTIIKKVEEALEHCYKQLTTSPHGILDPENPFLSSKRNLEAAIEKGQACAEFVDFVHKNAPKGAHLHVHFNAILPAEVSLEIATTHIKDPHVGFIPSKALSAKIEKDETLKDGTIDQKILNADWIVEVGQAGSFPDGESIASLEKEVSRGAKTESESKPISLLQRIKKKLIEDQIYFPTPDLTLGMEKSGENMWQFFNEKGSPVWKFLFEPVSVLEEYIRQVITKGLEQGIYYQEWRTMFSSSVIDSKDEKKDIKAYLDVVARIVKEEKVKNSKFLGAKIIYCVPRIFKPARVDQEVKDLIKLRETPAYRELIAGFDIVGEEERDNFNINKSYEDQIKELIESVKEDLKKNPSEIEYPFGLPFHTGESTRIQSKTKPEEKSKAQQNLEFLASLADEWNKELPNLQFRGGHTVLLSNPQNEENLQKYNDLNIHSELCLLSNNFLGTNKGASEFKSKYHPIIKGNSASLSGDDPTYQRSTPEDETMFAWRGGMTFREMIAVGEMSINAAILTEKERKALMKTFRGEWRSAIALMENKIPKSP